MIILISFTYDGHPRSKCFYVRIWRAQICWNIIFIYQNAPDLTFWNEKLVNLTNSQSKFNIFFYVIYTFKEKNYSTKMLQAWQLMYKVLTMKALAKRDGRTY